MTDPVILLGTQSNGETLPVQVNQFGQLVAEGLQGSEGPRGPEGPPGSDGENGGSFPLPPDPYEGALLGWLNGGLAWVGSPPVPIPEGIFGPIIEWNSKDNILTVQGEIPESVSTGVYLYQCTEQGDLVTAGWNTSAMWSPFLTPGQSWAGGPTDAAEAFDGSEGTYADSTGGGWIFDGRFYEWGPGPHSVELVAGGASDVFVNGQRMTPQGSSGAIKYTGNVAGNIETISTPSGAVSLYYIKINGILLVDTDQSLNYRVNTVMGNQMLGIPSDSTDFTVGAYLRIPQQQVARWVYRGDDGPLRELISTTDIDNPRNT